jgi:hypothetical protein
MQRLGAPCVAFSVPGWWRGDVTTIIASVRLWLRAQTEARGLPGAGCWCGRQVAGVLALRL